MNLIDLVSIAIIALFVINGLYKGFISTLLSIGAYIISVIFGFLFMRPGAAFITGHQRLFNMMLYYTEGSEFIADPEFVRTEIYSLSSADINGIIESARLPFPMGREIAENIAKEAFAGEGIVTLGDYFNQTIVCTFINILVFLLVFAMVRLILGLIINGADYADPFPVLRAHDGLLGGALGLVRGMLALFVVFMLVPVVLTVLGQFELITNMVDDSAMAGLFYRLNFLLSLAA
ncbi:MAG: CvpA family protein [Clostridia bacterium]|nr:CvpA family protein [Clostridia bacterium]